MAETVTFNDNAADKYDKDIYNSTVEKGWNIVPLMPSVRGDIPIASEQKPGHVYAVYPKTAGLITLGRYTDNTNLVPVSITADAENVIVDLAAFTVDFTNCVTDVDTVLLDIDLTGITDVDNLFYRDPYLMKVSADLPEVTKTDYLFSSSPELTNIDNISAVNATSTAGMFYGCDKLKKINRGMDFRKSETSFGSTLDFSSCIALEEIRPRILLNPTITTGDIDYIFSDLPLLKSISIDLGGSSTNMTMYYTFGDCTSLTNVEIINSQICTAFDDTFSNCSSLKNIELDVSKSTSFNSMFWRCENLETVTLNALNGYQENLDISYMFEDCYKLKSVIGVIDYSKSNSKIGDRTFDNCALLQDLQIKGINNDADFSKCPSLSADSIHYILSNLTDLSIGDTPLSYPSKVIKFNDACRTRILPSDAIEANRKMFIIEPEASYIQFQYATGTTPSLSDFTITGTEYTSEVVGDKVIISYADKITNIAYTSENIIGIVGSGLLSLTNMGGANCKQPMSLASIEIYGENQIANVDSMFENNTNITAIHRLDLNNVTSAKNMFKGCTALTDVSEAGIRYSISLKNATNVSHMFDGCTALTNVKSIDIRSATDVSYLFNGCSSLITSDNIILANKDIQINMEYCFNGCSKLTGFYTNTPEWFENRSGYDSDMSCVTNLSHAFDNCSALTEPSLCNLNTTIDLSQTIISPYYIEYTLENVLVVEAKSITFPANSGMYIMQGDYNNAVSKGWTVTPVPTPKITFRSGYNSDLRSSITVTGSGHSINYDPKTYRVTIYNIENVTSVVYGDIKELREIEVYDAVKLTHLGKSGSYNTQPTSITKFILKGPHKLTSMYQMFYKNVLLEEADIEVGPTVTTMKYMFYSCPYLDDFSNIKISNTSSVTNFYGMFDGCTRLIEPPMLDMSGATTMYEMFDGCTSMKRVPALNTPNVTTMQYAFYNCKVLNTIEELDMAKVTNVSGMLSSATAIQTFNMKNLNMSFNISTLTSLTAESIHFILRNLTPTTTTKTITFASSLKSSITVDDFVYANSIGWTVSPVIDFPAPDPASSYIKLTYPTTTSPAMNQATITDPTNAAYVGINGGNLYVYNASGVTNVVYTSTAVTEVYCKDTPNLQYIGKTANSNGQATSIQSFTIDGTNNITNAKSMFSGCSSLTAVGFDTSKVTDMTSMFNGCSALTIIPDFNTSNVTNMASMFYGCDKLTTISSLDTSNVTNMGGIFMNCTSLTTIPLLNTSKVTNMNAMFGNCSKLTTIPLLDTSKVTNMGAMFSGSAVTSIPKLNMVSVENMNSMFSSSTITTIPDFSTMTTKIKVEELFSRCQNLINVNLDCSYFSGLSSTFLECNNLETITLTNTSHLTVFAGNMSSCPKLKSVGEIDLINANASDSVSTSNQGMNFINCPLLETALIKNLKMTEAFCDMVTMSAYPNLTAASIHTILSTLQDASAIKADGGMRGIMFAQVTDEALTAKINVDDYKAAIEKGWTIYPNIDLPAPAPESSYVKFTCDKSSIPMLGDYSFTDPTGAAYLGTNAGDVYLYDASGATNVVYSSTDVTGVQCKDTTNLQYIGTADNSNQQASSISSFAATGVNKITDTSNMFNACTALTSVQLDTSKVTNMNSMFKGCTALTTTPQLNYSSVESMDDMFNGSGITTLPDLSTMTKTIPVVNLFYGCNGITSVVFDCTHFNSMKYTFSHCQNVETARLTNVDNVIEFVGNFEYCNKLVTVDELDLMNATKGVTVNIELQEGGLNFVDCTSLQNVMIKNLKLSEMFATMSGGTALPLTKESIHYILDNVSDMGINVLDIMMLEMGSGSAFEGDLDTTKMRTLGFSQDNTEGKVSFTDYINATIKGWLIMPMLLQDQSSIASFTYIDGSTVSASDFTFTTIPNTTYDPVYTITGQTIEFSNVVNVSEIVYPETISKIVINLIPNLSRITYDTTINGSRLSNNMVSYISINIGETPVSMDISKIAQNCTNLQRFTNVSMASNAKYSFDGCSNLTSCTLYIGEEPVNQRFDHLFDGCTQLSSLTLMGVSNTIDLSALTNIDKLSVNNILRNLGDAFEPEVSTITFDNSKKDLIEEDAYLMARAKKWVVIPSLDNVSSYIKFTYKDGTTPSVSDFTITGTEYTSTITGQDIIFENAYLITNIVYSSENITKVDAHNIISATHIGKTGTYSTQPASVVEFTLYGKNAINDATRMFENCSKLVTVHRLDAFYGNTTATRMFYGCTSLETLPELKTGRLSSMDYMFTNCTKLKTIKSIDLSGIYSQYYFDDIGFDSLTSLITLDISGFDTMSPTLTYDLSKLVSLSADSIHNILYDLPVLNELIGASRTIKFADVSVTSIQQSDYISATNKGWTILPNVSLDPPTADSVLTFTYKAGTAPTDISGFAISSLNDHTVDLSQPDKVIFNMATNIVAIRYPDDQNIIGISIENMRNLTSIICKKYEGDIVDSPNRQTTSLTSFKISGANKMTNLKYLLFLCDGLTDATLDLTTFDTSNVTIMDTMFGGCTGLTTLDLSHFNVSNVTSVSGIFWHCEKLTSINLASWDTSNIVSFSSMFNGCKALTSVDVSHFNTDRANDMNSMFADCSKLTSIDVSHFNTSGVTTMMTMFGGCSSLTSLDLSTWDTSNLNNITQMFEFVRLSTLDLSTFKTTRLRYMYSTFFGANIGTLNMSTFDTSRVVEMASMFREASVTNLNISALNTSNVTDMSFMFGNCYIGTSNLDFSTFNTSNVTNMNYMFYNNTWLTTIPSFDTSKVTTMIRAFENCQNATGTWTISYDGDVKLSYDNLGIFDNTTKPITMRYKASNTIAANYAAPSNVTKEVIA